MSDVYYSRYLQLDKILAAQSLESDRKDLQRSPAHDEMLFIVIHQTYELWFKQILHEVQSVADIFQKKYVEEGPDMAVAVRRLQRVNTILQVLVHQIDIMETMTPLDFLDFRDMLRPASGFQSLQWKQIESLLGLKQRHGDTQEQQQYYVHDLKEADLKELRSTESRPSLFDGIIAWLGRMPFGNADRWPGTDAFWKDLRAGYAASLDMEKEGKNLEGWDAMLVDGSGRRLDAKAARAALFILLYRDEPLFHRPFELLKSLLDIDEAMALWRSRHMNMVRRMIGMRVGTGGSSGASYLKKAMEQHYVFGELAELNSFLLERGRLPKLPEDLKKALGYGH